MKNIKTILVYLIGLIGLVGASLLFSNQGEPVEIRSVPTTVPATKISRPATLAAAGELDTCTSAAQGTVVRYVPNISSTANSNDDRLSISGTVYAGDAVTPLSAVLISIYRENPEHSYKGQTPFIQQVQTNTTGGYNLTIDRSASQSDIYYRVSYQNSCFLSMHLKIITVSLLRQPFVRDGQSSGSRPANTLRAEATEAGPVFHNTKVDIILPVPPPTS